MSKKIFLEFVDNIPDAKLQGFPPRNGPVTLYTQPESDGQNYRLDKQSVSRTHIQHVPRFSMRSIAPM